MTDNNQSDNNQAGQSAQPAEKNFVLRRIYLKDLSFETPAGLSWLQKQIQPKVDQEVNTRVAQAGDDIHEVVLMVTITGKHENEVLFLIEVQQGGLFLIQGMDEDEKRQLIAASCPTILFPYVRETIDTVLTRGGLPPLMLQPINFAFLYQQDLARRAAAGTATH